MAGERQPSASAVPLRARPTAKEHVGVAAPCPAFLEGTYSELVCSLMLTEGQTVCQSYWLRSGNVRRVGRAIRVDSV